VQEQAGAQIPSRPDLAGKCRSRVLDVGVQDAAVAVAVDLEPVPLVAVEPQRSDGDQLAG
jgi:hypothetical protein